MEYMIESLTSDWETFLRFAPRIIYATLLLTVVISLSKFLGRAVADLLAGKTGIKTDVHFIRYLVSWTLSAIGVLLALGVLGLEGVAAGMLATGGVFAIVAGFAFREIGENLLAGFFLSFSRPFELKDLIRSGD
jgi:small-conductance mechanosensitive channel